MERDGIFVNGQNYKIRVLVITTDTVARPVIRNSTQFNGEFGCDFCLHKDTMIIKYLFFICDTNSFMVDQVSVFLREEDQRGFIYKVQ